MGTICTIGITTAISIALAYFGQKAADRSSQKMYEKGVQDQQAMYEQSKRDQEAAYLRSMEDQRRIYEEQLREAKIREEEAAKRAIESSRAENELYLSNMRARTVGTGLRVKTIYKRK